MDAPAQKGKPAAIIAYLYLIGTIIAFFMNKESKNPFAGFHIRQALGIHVTFYLLGVLVSMFDSWWISGPFYVFIFILWGYGIVGAIQGQANLVPVLGIHFQKWFSTIR